MQIKRRKTGFTLVEIIVAGVILCAAVLALGAISTRSMHDTQLNRQYEQAILLVDRQFSVIDYMGIENFIEAGRMEGDFEDVKPAYHWKVGAERGNIGSLYNVNVTVSWVELKRPHNVSADTMFNSVRGFGQTEIK